MLLRWLGRWCWCLVKKRVDAKVCAFHTSAELQQAEQASRFGDENGDFGCTRRGKKPYTGNFHANPIVLGNHLPDVYWNPFFINVTTRESCYVLMKLWEDEHRRSLNAFLGICETTSGIRHQARGSVNSFRRHPPDLLPSSSSSSRPAFLKKRPKFNNVS